MQTDIEKDSDEFVNTMESILSIFPPPLLYAAMKEMYEEQKNKWPWRGVNFFSKGCDCLMVGAIWGVSGYLVLMTFLVNICCETLESAAEDVDHLRRACGYESAFVGLDRLPSRRVHQPSDYGRCRSSDSHC